MFDWLDLDSKKKGEDDYNNNSPLKFGRSKKSRKVNPNVSILFHRNSMNTLDVLDSSYSNRKSTFDNVADINRYFSEVRDNNVYTSDSNSDDGGSSDDSAILKKPKPQPPSEDFKSIRDQIPMGAHMETIVEKPKNTGKKKKKKKKGKKKTKKKASRPALRRSISNPELKAEKIVLGLDRFLEHEITLPPSQQLNERISVGSNGLDRFHEKQASVPSTLGRQSPSMSRYSLYKQASVSNSLGRRSTLMRQDSLYGFLNIDSKKETASTIERVREAMGHKLQAVRFEKESIQHQLEEEIAINIELTARVDELETKVKHYELLETSSELGALQEENKRLNEVLDTEREKARSFRLESENKILELQRKLKDHNSEIDWDTERLKVVPGKSQGQLQGELLVAHAKISELQEIIDKYEEADLVSEIQAVELEMKKEKEEKRKSNPMFGWMQAIIQEQ